MTEFLASYAWILWVGLILVFLIVEMFTLEFTFLMLAIGSVGGLVSQLVGVPWYWQILIAAAISVLLIFTIRPPLLRALRRGGDPLKTNVAALLGIEGTVTQTIADGIGQVKLSNGDQWTAKLSPDISAIVALVGDRVIVTAIEGATAVVVPAERSTQ
jgi:membrane protein implicated in regulation of membrane protease activity